MKLSTLIFRALLAAEKEMPAESRALIEHHDALYAEWRKTDWKTPIPELLAAASEALKHDPLTAFAMELRRQGNTAAHQEWQAAQAAKEAA